jgi:hypothetical protein
VYKKYKSTCNLRTFCSRGNCTKDAKKPLFSYDARDALRASYFLSSTVFVLVCICSARASEA